MQGTFALPFAEAESVMLTLARDLDAQADAMVAPAGFQGRTARAFAGAQAERRVTLNRLSESAYSAAHCCVHQNFADEELAAAPSPQEVATQAAKVKALDEGLTDGFGSVTAVLAAKQALAELRAQREAALDAHAAESTRMTGCLGHLDIPPVAGRSGDGGGGDDPGGGVINPKLPDLDANTGEDPGDDAAPAPQPSPEEPTPPPDSPSVPGAPEAPISVGPSAPSVPGGSAAEIPGAPPLVPATGLSGGGMAVPQSPMMQPMQMPPAAGMPTAGMPGGGGFGFPMPGMPPVPGSGFTAPATGRQLDPLPRSRNRETTKEDLDLTLFPNAVDGGTAGAAAPAAVAGVGAAIAGAVTQANVSGVTPPVVSALPPANPMSGGGTTPGGPYGGGMTPMGSGAGMAGGGSIVKREPILAADGGTVAAESLRESVANGLIGRATADAPPPERAAS